MLDHLSEVAKTYVENIKLTPRFMVLFTLGFWFFVFLTVGFKTLPAYAVPFITFFAVWATQKKKGREDLIRRFALRHGYRFHDEGSLHLLESSVFSQGHSQKMYHVVEGHFARHPFLLFTFQYSVGYGKNEHDFVSTVFELDFQKTMPHMVLVSKKMEQAHQFSPTVFTLGLLDNSIQFNTSQKNLLSLEGDFYKYFDLFVVPNLEIEALEIFTPDLMLELIRHGNAYSIEFIDDKIYIYYDGIVSREEDLMMLYSLARTMSERMARLLERKRENWFNYAAGIKNI